MKTKYTPTLMRKICQGLASGRSLESVCSGLDVAPQTVQAWRHSIPEAADDYQAARQDQAWTWFDQQADLAEQLEQISSCVLYGFLDPRTAKAAVRALESRHRVLSYNSGKMLPAQFGDATRLELSGQVGVTAAPMSLEDLKADLIQLAQEEPEIAAQLVQVLTTALGDGRPAMEADHVAAVA